MVTAVALIRLTDSKVAQMGEDTEIFRVPVQLQSGLRSVRLSLSGAIVGPPGSFVSAYIKILDFVIPSMGFVNIAQTDPPNPSIFASPPIMAIATVIGGSRELIISINPTSIGFPEVEATLLCGSRDYTSYAWQAFLEDLGEAPE